MVRQGSGLGYRVHSYGSKVQECWGGGLWPRVPG